MWSPAAEIGRRRRKTAAENMPRKIAAGNNPAVKNKSVAPNFSGDSVRHSTFLPRY